MVKRLFIMTFAFVTAATSILSATSASALSRYDEQDYALDYPILITAKRDIVIAPGTRQVSFKRQRVTHDNDTWGLPNNSCALRIQKADYHRRIPHQYALVLERIEDVRNGWISKNGLFRGTYRQWLVTEPETGRRLGTFVCDDDVSSTFRQLRSVLGMDFFIEIYNY